MNPIMIAEIEVGIITIIVIIVLVIGRYHFRKLDKELGLDK